jgi:hypothetical protein
MEQSPSWEANRFAASQEILGILWNPKVHYRIHKCPPPVPILSQLDQSLPPHPTSLKIQLILSSHLRLGLPSGPFPSILPTKTLYTPPLSQIRATWPAHLILLDFITQKHSFIRTQNIQTLSRRCVRVRLSYEPVYTSCRVRRLDTKIRERERLLRFEQDRSTSETSTAIIWHGVISQKNSIFIRQQAMFVHDDRYLLG